MEAIRKNRATNITATMLTILSSSNNQNQNYKLGSRKSSLESIPSYDENKQDFANLKVEEKHLQSRFRSQSFSDRADPITNLYPEKRFQKLPDAYNPIKNRVSYPIKSGSFEDKTSRALTYEELLQQKPITSLKQAIALRNSFAAPSSNNSSFAKDGPFNTKIFPTSDNNLVRNREVSSITKLLTSVKGTDNLSSNQPNLKDFRASITINEDSRRITYKNNSVALSMTDRRRVVTYFNPFHD